MSEKSGIEKELKDVTKSKPVEITHPEFKLIDEVIQGFAPEIGSLYPIIEDKTEEQNIKTGRLHENRIMGVILNYFLNGKRRITTTEVKEEYRKFFKNIAFSTISNYLNKLIKESILYKEKDGRNVYFIFSQDPPLTVNPFWFTRIFCIVPAYFDRAIYFSKMYLNAEKYVRFKNKNKTVDKAILKRNFKFIVGLIILNILKNRSSRCMPCQFSKRNKYGKLDEIIINAINDRSDVLPEELVKNLIRKCSEILMFNGTNLDNETIKKDIILEILRSANLYVKDIDFQIKVSIPRKNLRLKSKKNSDMENINN